MAHHPVLALADWRRQIAELYARIRAEAEPERAREDWIETRNRLFARHPQSPLRAAERASFRHLPCYPYDPGLRLLADVEPVNDARTERLDLGKDGTATLAPAGRTRGLTDTVGGELTVYWIGGYGGGLFLPFTDATSGEATYGGGRYLLDTIKGADLGMVEGKLVLDFNFAYHPSCAYSPDWTCPLAPQANRLPHAIEGGEKLG